MIGSIGSSGYSQGMSAMWGSGNRPDPSQMAKELFTATDADNSGGITKEELTSALAAKAQDGQDGPDADELFSTLDADGDGVITEEEHSTGLAAMHKELAQASAFTSMSMGMNSMADQLFTDTDADGDGYISASELSSAISAKNEATGGTVDATELFSALDADGDGKISQDEHSAGLASMQQNAPGMGGMGGMGGGQAAGSDEDDYDAADTNEDGVVSTEELLASLGIGTTSSTSTSTASTLFSTLDTDGDGVISATEFSQGLSSLSSQASARADSEALSVSQAFMASRFDMYRLMGMDAQSSLTGSGLNATA